MAFQELIYFLYLRKLNVVILKLTVVTISIGTDRPEQTVQAQTDTADEGVRSGTSLFAIH